MQKNVIVKIIKWCLFLLLLGRGILHFTSPPPYETLFTNTSRLAPSLGFILLLFSALLLFPTRYWKKSKMTYFFILPSIILLTLSLSSFLKAGYVVEQFIEHALQWSLPILFVVLLKAKKLALEKFVVLLMIASSLTFIGHGLFALGWHYVPGNFIVMTTSSLHMSVAQAEVFLLIMGIIDLIVALAIFIKPARKISLIYMILWGLITSFARTYFIIGATSPIDFWSVNVMNTIYRTLHGAIPFVVFFFYYAHVFKTNKKLSLAKTN